MALVLRCDACGHEIPFAPTDAGKRGRCPACGAAIQAPAIGIAPTQAAPPSTRARTSDRVASGDGGTMRRSGVLEPDEVEQARSDPARCFGPFVLLSELGKGGMGVVYRAWNDRLRRVVALKTILAQEGVDPAAIARFQREAEAAARLRHPNIVAVHEAGEIGGRQYIAMDYVPGQSLEARLRPGPERIALHRAVEVLRDVARAVDHAHSQGVIHRDLKPQNIIIDASGHPFVLDFGLASIRSGGTKLTKTGTSMGTPAYMPPEQASGEAVDERADVYSLGATLYHVLASRPPFSAETDVNMIVAVLTKDPVPPSKLNPRAAGDLETICLKCLEKEPAKRYPTAAALADDLDAFLKGEPIAARPVGRLERFVRRARRNKLATAFGLLALAGALAAAGLGARSLEASRRAEDDARAALAQQESHKQAVLETIAKVRKSGPGFREAAVEALLRVPERQTVKLLADALDGISEKLAQATRDFYREGAHAGEAEPIAGVDRALAAWKPGERATGPLLLVEQRVARVEAENARARIGVKARSARTLLATEKQTPRLMAAGEIDLAHVACAALGKIGFADDAVPALGRYLAAEEDETRAAEAAEALLRIGRERKDAQATAFVEAARDRFGLDSNFWARAQRSYAGAPNVENAEPRTAVEFGNRANVRQAKGDLDGAIADGTRAIELDPSIPQFWNNRGFARASKGDQDGAISDCGKALELDPRLITGWHNRGQAKLAKGDLDGAIADFSRALEIDKRLARVLNDRGYARYKKHDLAGALSDLDRALELDPRLCSALNNRALVQQDEGDLDGAIAELGKAIELDPGRADVWSNRGMARSKKGDFAGAISDLEKAIELDPKNAASWHNKGCARSAKGDIEGAISDYGRALEIDPRLANSWNNRGNLRQARGDFEGALSDYKRALEIEPKNAGTWTNRGVTLERKGDFEGAIADFGKAIQLDPRLETAWVDRGNVRGEAGDLAGSVSDYSKALELDERDAAAWNGRGRARLVLNDLDGAISDCGRATELDPRMAQAWNNRGNARKAKGDLDGAISDYGKALEIEGNVAIGWTNRAHARRQKGDLDGAISDYGKSIELDPRWADAFRGRALARFATGDKEGAAKDAERFLELAPNDYRAGELKAKLEEVRRSR